MVNFQHEYDELKVKIREDFTISRNYAADSPGRGTEEEEGALVHGGTWFPSLTKEETITLRDGLNAILKAYHLDRADVEADAVYRLRKLPPGAVVKFGDFPAVWLKTGTGAWISQDQVAAESRDFDGAANLKVLYQGPPAF